MKLVDPNGDSIRNAYEKYNNVNDEISYYEGLIKKTSDVDLVEQYKAEIDALNANHRNFIITDKLLSDYKTYNETEYNIVNNIKYNGQEIDIYVSLSNLPFAESTGAVGETRIEYQSNSMKVEKIKNPIVITLYGNAFDDGHNGVGSLANEFGDVIFGVKRPDYNSATNNMNLEYNRIPTTRFSFDYEYYIISKGAIPKPNIYAY